MQICGFGRQYEYFPLFIFSGFFSGSNMQYFLGLPTSLYNSEMVLMWFWLLYFLRFKTIRLTGISSCLIVFESDFRSMLLNLSKLS